MVEGEQRKREKRRRRGEKEEEGELKKGELCEF